MAYTFGDDEIEDDFPEGVYNFKYGYGDEPPTKDMSFSPIISYMHIDIGITKYHFHLPAPAFDEEDRKIYFQKLKKYSNLTLEYLSDKSPNEEHFKLEYDIRSPVFGLLEELFKVKITDENAPIIGHFALYTTPATPEEIESGTVKSPRIFFLLDNNSIFHILFYDPFHQINKIGKSTIASLKKQS